MFAKKNEDNIATVLPKANIFSVNDNIVLAVEMPGVDKSSLDVSLDGNLLTVKGKKKSDSISKGYTIVHQERELVEYKRTFELNTDINRDNIIAKYTNGVLSVTLEKTATAQPKKIEIHS